MGSAISIKALSKIYKEGFWRRDRLVLNEVSFEVPQGQIFGFLGANGAGKTTTIKIGLGLQSPTRGSVEIFGQPSSEASSRRKLGFLPERPYFHTNLTANEFLDFHRQLYGPAPEGKKRRTNAELLALVGVPKVGDLLLRTFSKGMLQRAGIAQALINDPDLIVLDEPMSGLDPVGRREVRNLMVELNRSGKTVFFSSHILSDIESICQRIAFLEKGVLKYCGSIEDLLENSSQEIEILVKAPEASMLSELKKLGTLEAWGHHHRLLVKAGDSRPAVEKAWSVGAEVLSFGRVHRSLEDVLFGGGAKK